VHLIEVDVVRAQSAQTVLSTPDDVMPGESHVVRSITHGHSDLGCDQHVITIGAEGLAQYFLRESGGVNVCGVDQVDAGVAC